MSETEQERNKRVFGITHPTWVSNEPRDPSTDKIFERGDVQGTREMSAKEIAREGLYGWYRRAA